MQDRDRVLCVVAQPLEKYYGYCHPHFTTLKNGKGFLGGQFCVRFSLADRSLVGDELKGSQLCFC
jgi:hypothetical protein